MSRKPVTVIQFAKPNAIGKVKTRLAKSIGDDLALSVHQQLCVHVNRQLQSYVERNRVPSSSLWLAMNHDEPSASSTSRWFWANGMRWGYSLQQYGADLGERMYHALRFGLKFSDKVLLVGSDFPVLDNDFLEGALISLDSSDMVLAPCDDGGYGLIGIRTGVDPSFSGVEWGSIKAKKQTLLANSEKGYSVAEMEVRHDVDTLEDLQRWYRSHWRPSEYLVSKDI